MVRWCYTSYRTGDDLPDPTVVHLLLRRRCIDHKTKHRVGHMQSRITVDINLRNSTVHRKQHIMMVEAIECVAEIKFHQHMIWRQWLNVSTC